MISGQHDVIVLGAGASGLTAAAEAGRRGRSVLVLEHNARAGEKIRISGGGRCNFTNLNAAADHYLSLNNRFCVSAIATFPPGDVVARLERAGIPYVEKDAGQLFCASGAGRIVDMLLDDCRRAGASVLYGCRVASVRRAGRFFVTTNRGVFSAPSLIVASGGISYRKLGASDIGHRIARQFGLPVTPLRPALVPLTFGPPDRGLFSALSGISVRVSVRCGKARFDAPLLFTHHGLSGPAILQISSYWEADRPLLIDLSPGRDIFAFFKEHQTSRMEMRTLLASIFPKRLAETWCERHVRSKPLCRYTDKELRTAAEALHHWNVLPSGTAGFETAEATLGGIDTAELSSKTMEAKKVPGLYFTGEVIDVTGQLGGYNLQWAWSSGAAAGRHA